MDDIRTLSDAELFTAYMDLHTEWAKVKNREDQVFREIARRGGKERLMERVAAQ